MPDGVGAVSADLSKQYWGYHHLHLTAASPLMGFAASQPC